jgi:hypothetical protein
LLKSGSVGWRQYREKAVELSAGIIKQLVGTGGRSGTMILTKNRREEYSLGLSEPVFKEETPMSPADNQVLVDPIAAQLAFRAGQLLEELLLNRGQELAESEGAGIVAPKHVESALHGGLFEKIINRLKDSSDERTQGKPPASIRRGGHKQAA